MPNPLLGPIMRWFGKLSYPRLFAVAAALFLLDSMTLDPIPFIDELLLGLGTLLLANWKKRKEPDATGKPPIEGDANR